MESLFTVSVTFLSGAVAIVLFYVIISAAVGTTGFKGE